MIMHRTHLSSKTGLEVVSRLLSEIREIHNLDPQPHLHCKPASGICASGYAVLPGEVLVT